MAYGARTNGVAGHDPRHADMHVNGDGPPPSTLAAQIVHNQTRPLATQSNGEQATFAGLLHELLHNSDAAPETDVAVNVQLIAVVVKAGLSVLTHDNPFALWEELLSQAADSLKVVKATIARQPEVLVTAVQPDGPRLLLWLVVRLLPICGNPRCQDLQLADLLTSAITALEKSTKLWRATETMRALIRSCVDHALVTLESSDGSTARSTVVLPPMRWLTKLWPESETAIALPQDAQIVIDNSMQVILMSLTISRSITSHPRWLDETYQRLHTLLLCEPPQSRRADTWRDAIVRTLKLSRGASQLPILADLLADSTQILPSQAMQRGIAEVLRAILQAGLPQYVQYLEEPLLRLVRSNLFQQLDPSLKSVMTQGLRRQIVSADLPDGLRDADQDMVDVDNSQLSRAQAQPTDLSRVRKRRRLWPQLGQHQSGPTFPKLAEILGGDLNDLHSLVTRAPAAYGDLDEFDQCAVWASLNETLCQVESSNDYVPLLASLLDALELQNTKKPRVLCMQAIRACVRKSTDMTIVDLAASRVGQVTLRALHSSLRELRIAAAHCLPAFLHIESAPELSARNQQVALQYLRTLSDRDVPSELETLIVAWGQVATVSGENELNLVLLQLVDLLGHVNPIVCGLAFSEIERVAETKALSVEQLFAPYWSSVAVSAVSDLLSRPQKIQHLCDLLRKDVNQLLLMTQRETIPSLVLHQKKDELQRIASARGANVTIQDICLQPQSNLVAILSLLLAQPSADLEDTVLQCLSGVAPGFDGTDLAALIKPESVAIACELLRYIGDQPPSRKSRAYHAFQLFTNLSVRRPGQSKAHNKLTKTLAVFFETHILGMMASFSDVLSAASSEHSRTEQQRCLQGIAEMVLLAKSEVSIALPQIRACLQSAIEQKELCDDAWSAWLSLLPVLESDDIALITDQTFTLIVRHWAHLPPALQQTTYERVTEMIRSHNAAINKVVLLLPILTTIPLFAKLGTEIERLQNVEATEGRFKAFTKRLKSESKVIVLQALTELVPFLETHQGKIHDAAMSEQPDTWMTEVVRSLLDVTTQLASESDDAADLCGKCLGIVGCLDPNRVNATRPRNTLLIMSNFDKADEVIKWVVELLENVLVKAFKSASNARSQGFLAYVMQELLRFCEFNDSTALRPRATQGNTASQRWLDMPEHVRTTLTPFLTSRYLVTSHAPANPPHREYPGFTPDSGHGSWLRGLVYDLMWKAKGDNAKMVFPLLARVIRGHDLSIAHFLLPYALTNVVLGGTVTETKALQDEILAVLKSEPSNSTEIETIRLCSESVFTALDYMSLWLQGKKNIVSESRATAWRTGHSPNDFDEVGDQGQIQTIEQFLGSIPAEVTAARAMNCESYARGLFNWEQHIRQGRPLIPSASSAHEHEDLYDQLFDIYAQIDEPDGLEGLAVHLPFLTDEQQAALHVRAGRWTAAQSWYELQLADSPDDTTLQTSVLQCFRETGRYAPLLRYADSFSTAYSSDETRQASFTSLLPVMAEASCMIGDLEVLKRRLTQAPDAPATNFDIGLGAILVSGTNEDPELGTARLAALRRSVTTGISAASASSLQTCHTELKNLHILYEVEVLSRDHAHGNHPTLLSGFEKRLGAVGSYTSGKQSILGIRRAKMQSGKVVWNNAQVGASWLATAKLARKAGNSESAYNAVLRAHECGDVSAKLEEARLLWHDGHGRQAIQSLESAIAAGKFDDEGEGVDTTATVSTRSDALKQNMLLARAHLMVAKWLDASGQTQTKDMTAKYQYAAKTFQRWERGHYYLGKHYHKLLLADLAQPRAKQSEKTVTGDLTRLIIENLLRSIPFGNKYWHETIPKVLTLWLDLGTHAIQRTGKEPQNLFDLRVKALQACSRQFKKYFDRVPPYIFYQALPQMLSRISHPHPEVWKELMQVITKITLTHPSQALWRLLAVTKATDGIRRERATEVISRLKDPKLRDKAGGVPTDLLMLIVSSQRLADGLLHASEAAVEARATQASLSRDLGFNHKLAPCSLVVPLESTLTASVPNIGTSANIRSHKAFAQDKVTIQAFEDEVRVLSSLQRPKKVTVRGSDGKRYSLLCKPKDDLRKDQRLMEFNGVINRALKRDAESSKRRLYIKTYAVIPLSEESGILEWVEGITPIRDILLNHYGRRNIRPNYVEIRAVLNDCTKDKDGGRGFIDKVLPQYPPLLHEWFAETYPEPDKWFAARVMYARSAAVMSIVGHVLGLGDRHGENILLREATGGVFHVDFNCLFDKGMTFERPELVPFRLTRNMVDAMGPYGYEGPFRRSCELTLGLLRQNKDTLNTILETFLYDPTTDFIGKKKKHTDGVPETPQEILDSVQGKLKGIYKKETVPLSTEGYVDALIREAVDPWNLSQMYIGWCAFL
nr:hypothetical protein B0A51_16256 [Rachicladosporium sp. CCFEE 5018]OQO27475.1 hypothetical protein B0A51_06559 [Rachicladosporium sp. CCFEE 5018]